MIAVLITFSIVLAAVVCLQFPQIGELIVKRLIIQFRKGYRRSDKSLCMSASRFIAHLVNQRVVSILLSVKDVCLFVAKYLLAVWQYDSDVVLINVIVCHAQLVLG